MGPRRGSDEFEAFFRAEYPAVVRSLTRVVGDRGRAEEIAQDAFCRALERWARVRNHERPGAWVQLVALRRAMRVIHRDRRRGERERSATQPAPAVDEPVDVDLHRAIAALPRLQRAAVILYYLGDLSVLEAAAVLEVSEGAIKTSLSRARRSLALRLRLDEEELDASAG